MTATRTLAKKTVKNFFEKAFAKGKKLKTRFQGTKAEKRVFSEHSGEDRSGLAPDSLLRESCDSPPASSKSRRSRRRTRKRDAVGVGVRGRNRIDRRAERSVPRNANKRRFHYRVSPNFVNGGRTFDDGRRSKERALKGRFAEEVGFETFEFRAEFVLLNFVVHRFFANAEFARGESTATVASDERFEKSRSFDLRKRQTGEAERRRRRKVGAFARTEGNGEKRRRFDGRRKSVVGDGNARFVVGCVAR